MEQPLTLSIKVPVRIDENLSAEEMQVFTEQLKEMIAQAVALIMPTGARMMDTLCRYSLGEAQIALTAPKMHVAPYCVRPAAQKVGGAAKYQLHNFDTRNNIGPPLASRSVALQLANDLNNEYKSSAGQ